MRISIDSTDFRVYSILSESPASGESIAEKLKISRTAVWKVVQKLKEWGVEVIAEPKGYRIESQEELNPYEVARIAFKNGFREVLFFDETDSTNERAKEFRRPDAIVFANRQSKGKGRHGRVWLSERGGLYFSLILSPKLDYSELPKLTLIAGLSVAESIEGSEIKWPNDVLIGNKKVCGILSEVLGEIENLFVVIGIGINVSNPVPENAISLSQLYHISRREIFERVLRNFSKNYKELLNGNWSELRERIVAKCTTIGRRVKVLTAAGEIEGIAETIAEDGSLVVNGRRIYAGDCIHLR